MAGGGPPPDSKQKSPNPQELRSSSDPCDISFRTSLASVRTSNTADLKNDIELDVQMQRAGQTTAVVCVRTDKNEVVGVVLHRFAQPLKKCIEQGHSYVATITDFDYGLIEVSIRRRR